MGGFCALPDSKVYLHCFARVLGGTESCNWDLLSAGTEIRERAAILPGGLLVKFY